MALTSLTRAEGASTRLPAAEKMPRLDAPVEVEPVEVEPVEPAEPILPVTLLAFLLAGLYAVLTPIQLMILTGAARPVMTVAVAGSSLFLVLLAIHLRSRSTVGIGWVTAVATVPLVNAVTRLAITGDLRQTTPMMLVAVGIGAGVASRPIAAALIGTDLLAWVTVVLTRHTASARASENITQYGTQFVFAMALATVLHTARSRREQGLREVRNHLARQVAELTLARRAQFESEHRYRSLFDASPVGIGLSDENGHFLAVNPALCRLLDLAEVELIGASSEQFSHPDDPLTLDGISALLTAAEDGIVSIEKRFARRDDSTGSAWLTLTHTPGPQGQPWTLTHMQDITSRKNAEHDLLDSEANLAAVGRVMRNIQRGEDARTGIVEAARELASASYASLVEPDADAHLVVTAATEPTLLNARVPLSATAATVEVFVTGRALFIPDPHEHPLVSPALLSLTDARSIYLVPVTAGGQTTGVLIVAWKARTSQLTQRAVGAVETLADQAGVALEHMALLAELERLAATDPLTDLPNRRGWQRELGQLMQTARRTGKPLTVAMADLDHFKSYNDTHGHLAGDGFLHDFAVAARNSLRAVDTVARWGGEEFAIALPDCPHAEAVHVLDRVRGNVPEGQTCSIGYATWDTVETAEQLIRRADEALYLAKDNGRNRTSAHRRP
jgi:diguanylate cyclase (GGDEF)-like protein/PAS domain S-box-containing protein